MIDSIRTLGLDIWCRAGAVVHRMKTKLYEDKGQGTVEYAILVGVLVVIAIVAVAAFRGKLQDLWSSIVSGINSL